VEGAIFAGVSSVLYPAMGVVMLVVVASLEWKSAGVDAFAFCAADRRMRRLALFLSWCACLLGPPC